ncbi:HTH-type transcriptional regulator sinR, partial [Dysosmobacter welbionis]
GVPALQPGEGRPEHGADPAALQAGGHRPAEGPAGTGVPCACRGQGQAERRVPPVLPGPAGNLCGAGPGADGDSVNLNTTGAGADTVPAPFTAAHIRPSASLRRYVKTFP